MDIKLRFELEHKRHKDLPLYAKRKMIYPKIKEFCLDCGLLTKEDINKIESK